MRLCIVDCNTPTQKYTHTKFRLHRYKVGLGLSTATHSGMPVQWQTVINACRILADIED